MGKNKVTRPQKRPRDQVKKKYEVLKGGGRRKPGKPGGISVKSLDREDRQAGRYTYDPKKKPPKKSYSIKKSKPVSERSKSKKTLGPPDRYGRTSA